MLEPGNRAPPRHLPSHGRAPCAAYLRQNLRFYPRRGCPLRARARPRAPLAVSKAFARPVGRSTDAQAAVKGDAAPRTMGGRAMRVEQSVIIQRTPDEVFTFLENRGNDTAWMKSVTQSEWLDSGGRACVGRRGQMVIKFLGRRNEFIDEVTEYVPGRRIAHRTIEGPFPLNTACICQPSEQ